MGAGGEDGTMNEALEILKEYIDERIAYVTDDPEWQSKRESERRWKEFVEAFLEAWETRMEPGVQ
jgi:hypothetical protein